LKRVSILILLSLFIIFFHSSMFRNIIQNATPHSFFPISCLILPDSNGLIYAEGYENAIKNYIGLEKLYIKWKEGLFGGRGFFRRLLEDYLINLIGNEILTDYNYFMAYPESFYDKKVECVFNYSGWLQIVGELKDEVVERLFGLNINISGSDQSGFNGKRIENGDEIFDISKRNWEVSRLFAIYGRIRKFKLEDYSRVYKVVLYVDDIRIIEIDDARKNYNK